MSIVSIVSGVYCSGDEIATRVAERLDYTLIGDKLLDKAAMEFDSTVKKLARAMTGDRSFFNLLTHEYEKSVIYLKATMAQLLAQDSVVYHGPATYLIPSSIGHVLRVGVVADLDYRLGLAAAAGVSDQEARAAIDQRDEELAAWSQDQQASHPWDPKLFDMKVPLPKSSVDEAVDLICKGITSPALMPTDRSIQAALDFLLATRVNLALLDRGYHHVNVKADEGQVVVEMTKKSTPPGALGRTVDALRQENLEDEARQICKSIEGVKTVDVLPYRKPFKTLLVDDEQEFAMTLSERLQMREIQSDVVFDGTQALDFVESAEPEVMVLDLRMPGIDGIEVLERVKRDHPSVEVIVVTAHGTEKDELIVRELGAFDYMQKPVDIQTLAEKIREASKKAKLARGADPEGSKDEPADPAGVNGE